ncbi:hypothetical protein Agub_g15302, partial [Astrephomene gubernaculifera]
MRAGATNLTPIESKQYSAQLLSSSRCNPSSPLLRLASRHAGAASGPRAGSHTPVAPRAAAAPADSHPGSSTPHSSRRYREVRPGVLGDDLQLSEPLFIDGFDHPAESLTVSASPPGALLWREGVTDVSLTASTSCRGGTRSGSTQTQKGRIRHHHNHSSYQAQRNQHILSQLRSPLQPQPQQQRQDAVNGAHRNFPAAAKNQEEQAVANQGVLGLPFDVVVDLSATVSRWLEGGGASLRGWLRSNLHPRSNGAGSGLDPGPLETPADEDASNGLHLPQRVSHGEDVPQQQQWGGQGGGEGRAAGQGHEAEVQLPSSTISSSGGFASLTRAVEAAVLAAEMHGSPGGSLARAVEAAVLAAEMHGSPGGSLARAVEAAVLAAEMHGSPGGSPHATVVAGGREAGTDSGGAVASAPAWGREGDLRQQHPCQQHAQQQLQQQHGEEHDEHHMHGQGQLHSGSASATDATDRPNHASPPSSSASAVQGNTDAAIAGGDGSQPLQGSAATSAELQPLADSRIPSHPPSSPMQTGPQASCGAQQPSSPHPASAATDPGCTSAVTHGLEASLSHGACSHPATSGGDVSGGVASAASAAQACSPAEATAGPLPGDPVTVVAATKATAAAAAAMVSVTRSLSSLDASPQQSGQQLKLAPPPMRRAPPTAAGGIAAVGPRGGDGGSTTASPSLGGPVATAVLSASPTAAANGNWHSPQPALLCPKQLTTELSRAEDWRRIAELVGLRAASAVSASSGGGGSGMASAGAGRLALAGPLPPGVQ